MAALQSEYSAAIGLSTLEANRSQEALSLSDQDATDEQHPTSEQSEKGAYRLSLPSISSFHLEGTDNMEWVQKTRMSSI